MKMKNIFKYIIAAASVSLISCSGFLDEKPLSYVTDKNYYQTAADAEGAVNAIYETVGIGSIGFWAGIGNGNTPYGGVFYNGFWIIQDLFADNAIHHNFLWSGFDNFGLSETDGNVKTLWYGFFRSINTANVAIDRIPAIKMDERKRNHLVAEARFWRGLLYGEMAKLWGDVPLRLHPSESVDELFGVVRANRMDVLNAALDDMDFAIGNLQSNYRVGYGRANSLMASAVAAKITLTKATFTKASADYQKAADYCKAVISSGKYDLYQNFGDNFVIEKEHGIESILSINYETGNLWGSQFNVSLLPSDIRANSPGGKEGPDNANSWIVPTTALFESYAQGDTRRDITIMKDFTYSDGSTFTFKDNAKFPYYYTKYWDRKAEPNGKNSGQNYPYMRFSEVLLIYAEALNEVNNGPNEEAYRAINRVRERAFNGPRDLSGLDVVEFRKAILDERRWELALEGSRWFDLVRLSTNFKAEILKVKPDAEVADKHKLLPIPQYERLLNGKITQNDGY